MILDVYTEGFDAGKKACFEDEPLNKENVKELASKFRPDLRIDFEIGFVEGYHKAKRLKRQKHAKRITTNLAN